MNRGHGFIVLLIIFHLSSFSQNIDRWTAGSARQLNGEVASLICFISTPNDNWSESEKDSVLRYIKKSDRWLIDQALSYNVKLNISNYILNNGTDIKFDSIEQGTGSGKERVDWIYNTLQKLGYKNSKKAAKKLKKKYDSDNLQMLIIAKGNGRSYAIRYGSGINKKKYFLEGMMLYSGNLVYNPNHFAAVYSHELLHLYGAWDLYATYAQTIDRQARATELYPNDIMLRVDQNQGPLKVDKLTAWLIGWNQTEEEHFEWFRPSDYNK